MKLIRAAARMTVLATFLQDFRKLVGEDIYLASLIRKEHGIGTGFFSISNTGSWNCLKESVRGMTDALDLRYRRPNKLLFRIANCLNARAFEKTVHRVEHTVEAQDLCREIEGSFILTDVKIELKTLAEWVIMNQITTWINQDEQLRRHQYDPAYPFSKDSSDTYYGGDDLNVTQLSRDEVVAISARHFQEEIKAIKNFDLGEIELMTSQVSKAFDPRPDRKYTLPPLELAAQFHSDMFPLLEMHYWHKLAKRTEINSKKYSAEDARLYTEWLKTR